MRLARLGLLLLLAGCAVRTDAPPTLVVDPLPAMKAFSAVPSPASRRPNREIARDILDLVFLLESGRRLERMSRFEGPIGVALAGNAPPTAQPDLAGLLARLRAEARIDIREVPPSAAQVTIEFVPRRRLQALVPRAACFVVPGVGSFAEFRAARDPDLLDWARVTVRRRATVLIPSNTAPQEVRDCLHEELAQAIGPLNDLYRLSDSVFNDDNFHTVLTGFDMLVLRAIYAPELRSGMTRAEVAARLPAILARIHPGGRGRPAPPPPPTPRAWVAAIEQALGTTGTGAQRRRAAGEAVAIAARAGWHDARLGFSLFALARQSLAREEDIAAAAMVEAAALYRSLPGGAIHAAHIDMQMAAFALSAGRPDAAIALTDTAIPVARRAQNAALLATLLMIRSESLRLQGQAAAARAARLDSLGWARYGFGTEAEVRARLSEVAALTPSAKAGRPRTRMGGGG